MFHRKEPEVQPSEVKPARQIKTIYLKSGAGSPMPKEARTVFCAILNEQTLESFCLACNWKKNGKCSFVEDVEIQKLYDWEED